MGRPRKNPLINPILPNITLNTTISNTTISNTTTSNTEILNNDENVVEVKETKKRGRKKEIKEINEGIEKMSLDNKPEEQVKKKRVLKKQIKSQNNDISESDTLLNIKDNKTDPINFNELNKIKTEKNIQEMMNDMNNINLNDFIVDNNLNNQIEEKKYEKKEINIFDEQKYNEKMNELNEYLNNTKNENNNKYNFGDINNLKLIENKKLYFYIYFNNYDIKNLNKNYMKTKKFILGVSTYKRLDDYSYFTSDDRDDWIYEKEIKINIPDNTNLELIIRIVNTKPLKSDIESDKWNIHLIEYQRINIEMTLKEVIEKVLTKNTWKYYETKENINFTIEKTLNTDNSYFLNKKARLMIDDVIYILNIDYRYIFEKIFEKLD